MRRLVGPLALLALACGGEARSQDAKPKAAAAAPATVQGITVTGERPVTQTLLDRQVYSVANDLQVTSGSAADVLNQVPSVAVDADGGLTLRGDANVTILVDGKPSAQFSGASRGLSLLQFPASDIDRIEVLTNPPAQYRAEGSGGVINIITKKSRREGLSGAARLSLGDKRRYVAGVDASYNKGPLKLAGGIGLRQDARLRETTSDRTQVDPTSGTIAESLQDIDEHFLRRIPSVKASVDYELGPNQALGASWSHRELIGQRWFDQHNSSGPPGAPATSLSQRHSDGHDWSADNAAGVTFTQKLRRPDETLSLDLQQSGNHERERYAYRNSFFLPPAASTFDDLALSHDLVKTEFAADYDLPLSSERELRLGYDLEADRDAFDNVGHTLDPVTGERPENPAVTNHFRYRQQVHAAYGQYETPLGPWRLQAGLRLEVAHVSFLQITGDLPGGRDEFAAYPSLHLDRALSDDFKLTASLSRRVSRPDPEQLNPFPDHQDTHNLRAGNPDLLPQDTWSYEAGFNGAAGAVTYGATVFYRFDRNGVTDVVRPISADVVLTTKANLPKSRSGGVDFNAGGKLGRRLSFSLSGELFHAQIDAGPLGVGGLRSTTGVNLKAGLDWRPTVSDTVQVSFSRQDRRLTPQGYYDAIELVNLGYRRQLRPDLAAVVTVSDAFDGQRLHRVLVTPVLHEDYVRHQFGQVAYVGLVWTFGAGGKAKQTFDYEL